MGWTSEDTFQFWVPAQAVVVKGGDKAGADKSGKRWIQGIASTEAKDLQGEIVDQNGIDFTYFLKHGYLNNDHKPGFSNKVGQPTECKLTKNGLWVKGFLFKDHQIANDIWELLNSLDASGSTRRLGFSIQGKVVKRAGSKIEKCWIQDIAVTPAPINTTTWAEIAKSLSAHEWDFNKSKDEDEEKAMTAMNSPLVPESLDSDVKKDKTAKSLTVVEAMELLKANGIPDDIAEKLVEVAVGYDKGVTND